MNKSFNYSLKICMSFMSLSCLIALSRISSIILGTENLRRMETIVFFQCSDFNYLILGLSFNCLKLGPYFRAHFHQICVFSSDSSFLGDFGTRK